jgi:hypothetical protein
MKLPVEYQESKSYDISWLEHKQIQRIGLDLINGNEIPENLKAAFEENFKSYLLTLD